MENMPDWPHLPFVHQLTIAKGMLARPDSRMDIRCEAQSWGMRSTVSIDGKEQPGALDLRWPIASDDKAIVEPSSPIEIPPAAAERSVRTDALPSTSASATSRSCARRSRYAVPAAADAAA